MLVARLLKDQAGSLLPTFAIAATAIIGCVGAAVDYSRGNAARTDLQAALDSTALMLSQEAEKLNTAELTQKAHDYFMAQFTRPEAKNVQVTSTITSPQRGNFILNVSATASLDTTVARVLGQKEMSIGSTAQVMWGIKKLELALVLDNTGSMAQNGKLSALKAASHNLLNTLEQAAKEPGDVKIAIIPFDRMVNISTAFRDESWIDYTVRSINKSSWDGCVIDRTQSNDVLDTAPVSTDYRTFFPAADCGSLVQAMPLTYDWTALRNKIDQMTAAGSTNITIGLAWGWHALTSGIPFTQAAAPAPDLDKVIVLLTDGENTQNRWTTSTSSIDARTSAACGNVKAANIRIYTVRVVDGNASLLRNCATSPSMYYDVQQADQLSGVFTSIAQALASLRLAR